MAEREFKRVEINTRALYELLASIEEVIDRAHDFGPFTVRFEDGRDTDNDKDARARKAALARELARAADNADLLAAELRVRFGRMKGYDDPRGEG